MVEFFLLLIVFAALAASFIVAGAVAFGFAVLFRFIGETVRSMFINRTKRPHTDREVLYDDTA